MNKFQELVDIIAALRDPETGCPWDAKQSSESLVSNFIEELYEVVEAIEEKDDKALCEELGDLLLHVVFQVQIAHEKKAFGMEDVLKAIIDKLVRRHPHVFGDLNVENADAVKLNWEHIKRVEKTDRESVLDGVPKSMPALIQAHQTRKKPLRWALTGRICLLSWPK